MIKTYNRQSIGCRNVIIAMVIVTCLIMYYQQVSASVIFNLVAFLLLLALFIFIAYWPITIIWSVIKVILNIFRHKTSDVDDLDWYQFENYIADKLRASGYTKVKLTEKYDLGVDIVAHKNGVVWGVQIKHSLYQSCDY